MWHVRTAHVASLVAGIAVGTVAIAALIRANHDDGPASAPEVRQPSAAAPDAQGCAQQVQLARGASDASKVAALEALAKRLAPFDSAQMPADPAACVTDAAALVSQTARASHRSHAFADADRLYTAYLAAFAHGSDAAENQYFLAEVRWSLAETAAEPRQADAWERAALAFDAVATVHDLDGKLRKEAAYAAVLGWKNAINNDSQPPPTDALVPVPMPFRIERLVAALEYERRNYAEGAEGVGMTFVEANTLRRYGRLVQAIAMFRDIVDHHRDHETAEYAANLLLDSYNRLGRHDEMLALANQLAADAKFLADKPDLAKTLARLKRQARGPHPEG
jgi:hypothetical protein